MTMPIAPPTAHLRSPFAATQKYAGQVTVLPLALTFDILTFPFQLLNVLTGFPPIFIPDLTGLKLPGPGAPLPLPPSPIGQVGKPTISIVSPLPGAITPAGQDVTLIGTASSASGSDLSDRIIWTSLVPSTSPDAGTLQIGSGRSVILTRPSSGPRVITAVVSDPHNSLSAEAVIRITVSTSTTPAPPLPPGVPAPTPKTTLTTLVIRSPTKGQVITTGTPITFRAIAIAGDGTDRSDNIGWFIGPPPTSGNLLPTSGIGRDVLYTFHSPGTVSVWAFTIDPYTGGAVTASVQVTVIAAPTPPTPTPVAPTVSITVPGDNAVFNTGDTIHWQASATSQGRDISQYIAWVIVAPSGFAGPWGTGATTVLTPQTVGTWTLEARVRDPVSGLSSTASRSIMMREGAATPPRVTIIRPAEGSPFTTGSRIEWQASATSQGRDISQYIAWAIVAPSGFAGPWGTGATTVLTPQTIGTWTLEARVRDPVSGLSSTASRSITVNAAAPPTPPTLPPPPTVFQFQVGDRVNIADFGPGTIAARFDGSPPIYNVVLDSTGETFSWNENSLSKLSGIPPTPSPSFLFNIGDRVQVRISGQTGTVAAQFAGPPITYNVNLDVGGTVNFAEAALMLPGPPPGGPSPLLFNIGQRVLVNSVDPGTVEAQFPGTPNFYNIHLDSGSVIYIAEAGLSSLGAPPPPPPAGFLFSVGQRVQVAGYGPGTVAGQFAGTPNTYDVDLDSGQRFNFDEGQLSLLPSGVEFKFALGTAVQVSGDGTGIITAQFAGNRFLGSPNTYNVRLDTGDTFNFPEDALSVVVTGPPVRPPGAFQFNVGDRVQLASGERGTVEYQFAGTPNIYNVRLDTGDLFSFAETELTLITAGPPAPFFLFNIGDRVYVERIWPGTVTAQFAGTPPRYDVRLDSGQTQNFLETSLSPGPTGPPPPVFRFNIGDRVTTAYTGPATVTARFAGTPNTYTIRLDIGGDYNVPETDLSYA